MLGTHTHSRSTWKTWVTEPWPYGWNDILYIPEDIADSDAKKNDLLSNFGKVTLDQIMDHVATYADATRTAQNSIMLYLCLANSITNDVKVKIMLQANEYYVR